MIAILMLGDDGKLRYTVQGKQGETLGFAHVNSTLTMGDGNVTATYTVTVTLTKDCAQWQQDEVLKVLQDWITQQVRS